MDTAKLLSSIGSIEVKKRVYSIIQRLQSDHYLEIDISDYKDACENNKTWFDLISVLNWYAHNFKPKYYLEVGVRKGRSMAQVLIESPNTDVFGFDVWMQDYGTDLKNGVHTTSPGRNFVLEEFRNLGILKLPTLIDGVSQKTLVDFFNNPKYPKEINLITIDGDHFYFGAKSDLDIAFDHLAPGGTLVFDDTGHKSLPDLGRLWEEYKKKFPNYLFIQDSFNNGVGVAFRPPFDYLFAER